MKICYNENFYLYYKIIILYRTHWTVGRSLAQRLKVILNCMCCSISDITAPLTVTEVEERGEIAVRLETSKRKLSTGASLFTSRGMECQIVYIAGMYIQCTAI